MLFLTISSTFCAIETFPFAFPIVECIQSLTTITALVSEAARKDSLLREAGK